MDIGPAVNKWTVDYLSNAMGGTPVKVHVSKEAKLDFLSKNFTYKTMPFNKFIEQCADCKSDDFLYLRSIGDDKRGRDISHISKQFPQIANDFKFPSFVSLLSEKDLYFSSVLRVASKELNLWTHYDIMDNILINVRGSKRVTLFSPEDIPYLYVVGDKSKITNIDESEDYIREHFPLFLKATKYECTLDEGDGLFIPSLWFHNVLSLNFTISVNIFWKDEDVHEFYDKNDVYGNKDLIPASNAFANIDKALKHLNSLPEKYKHFYYKMMINKIEQKF
ncbi:tRNA wybutosine-synthesizing protein 5-like protein [Dinothrombium tinctorium]|uniref:tRNA wybutosine-synthesizing protein 5-like protein n=1 Tax=Dinothrombium tinctorium TaxID=1965070 RepID=A0A3S4QTT3_9ACAR|nr:tRNA wybutosine-synthesizing protein 5-like protein [Dinothrombium tinctorium]RWS07687.1 tRNA wybutosine-synthesizing protein 5-like protein [Dinothrombium tinctorium]RWS07695.1 tRNA wybutosine-synthesizing protein 5-like protein [Dinothrombium tinctorium]